METDTRGMLDQWPFQPVHLPFAFAPCGFTSARLALPITKPLFLPACRRAMRRRASAARSGPLTVPFCWSRVVPRRDPVAELICTGSEVRFRGGYAA